MKRIFIPTTSADSWKQFLADPAHWKTGFSARCLAHAWEAADGIPPEVQHCLNSTPRFAQAELLAALPEYKVALPGGGRASQTDILAILRMPASLAIMAVEGKVSESFGETVAEWSRDASRGKVQRLQFLAETLGLSSIPSTIRYQLLHRTASAILEARKFMVAHAVMLVHSFSESNERFADYEEFGRLLSIVPKLGELVEAPRLSGPTLHIGWVKGDSRFLTS